MRLAIRRQQNEQTDRRGRSEGVDFVFSCQLELDANEHAVATKYDRLDYAIGQITDRNGEPRESIITVERLLDGLTLTTRYVSDAQETESTIREGCEEFKSLLSIWQSYGGEEVIEF
jgi:hypothetical protein